MLRDHRTFSASTLSSIVSWSLLPCQQLLLPPPPPPHLSSPFSWPSFSPLQILCKRKRQMIRRMSSTEYCVIIVSFYLSSSRPTPSRPTPPRPPSPRNSACWPLGPLLLPPSSLIFVCLNPNINILNKSTPDYA